MVLSSTFLDAVHILLQVQGPLDLKLENVCFITEEFKSSAQNLCHVSVEMSSTHGGFSTFPDCYQFKEI